MAQLVATRYRVTAPDRHVHGLSDRISNHATASIAGDAVALIKQLGFDQRWNTHIIQNICLAEEASPRRIVCVLDTSSCMPATDTIFDLHCAGNLSDVNLVKLQTFGQEHKFDNLRFVKG